MDPMVHVWSVDQIHPQNSNWVPKTEHAPTLTRGGLSLILEKIKQILSHYFAVQNL